MERDGYFFKCSDAFQNPLAIEFIPKDENKAPAVLEDFRVEVNKTKVEFSNPKIETVDTIEYRQSVVAASKVLWILFALLMLLMAFFALKKADIRFAFFSIISFFLAATSDFIGSKLVHKKTNGRCLSLEVESQVSKQKVFILIKGNEKDLSDLFGKDLIYESKEGNNENNNRS